MKRKLCLLAIVASMCAGPALACEPNCGNGWLDGDSSLGQWQEVYRKSFHGGEMQTSSGAQDLDMWGAMGGAGYKEYEALATQTEGLDVTREIRGGEVFNAHIAEQTGKIDITGRRGAASVGGSNIFETTVAVYGNKWQTPDGKGMTMGSDNTSRLNMDGSACLRGSGSVSYKAEVLEQSGHYQERVMPGGSGFTTSLSEQRGSLEIGVSKK